MGILIKIYRSSLRSRILTCSVIAAIIYILYDPSTTDDAVTGDAVGDIVTDSDLITDNVTSLLPDEPQAANDTLDELYDIEELDSYNEPEVGQPPTFVPGQKKNVLFLVADDLRPQIGAYFGRDYATPFDKKKLHTPNMDKLAEESLVLKRAYTQYSLCGPSRASMLTSRRPDSTKVYQNFVHWRESGGQFTSLPQYFKQNGYATAGIGKVFHVDGSPDKDDPISWTIPAFHAPNVRHVNSAGVNWEAVESQQRTRQPLEDEVTTLHAENTIKKLAPKALSGEKPFFLALGFYRPHVPQICPEEFFKMYPLETKEQYLAEREWQTPLLDPYCNMAPLQEGVDNSNLTHMPETTLRELRSAYFACVSYVDYLIGSLMQTLQDTGLADSTIVSLVADHGFHLGENNWYSKYTSHEIALHVPLMIRIPGLTDGGVESRSLVELVDLYPTIAEAAGLPPLAKCYEQCTYIRLCTEGRSLMPLISEPDQPLKRAAFSQLSRGRDMTEYSIRTDRYRYVDFAGHRRLERDQELYKHVLNWDMELEYTDLKRALYDHDKDPEERINVVDHPSYRIVVQKLKEKLQKQFSVIYDYPQKIYDQYT